MPAVSLTHSVVSARSTPHLDRILTSGLNRPATSGVFRGINATFPRSVGRAGIPSLAAAPTMFAGTRVLQHVDVQTFMSGVLADPAISSLVPTFRGRGRLHDATLLPLRAVFGSPYQVCEVSRHGPRPPWECNTSEANLAEGRRRLPVPGSNHPVHLLFERYLPAPPPGHL
jgi:hypothetical protein